MTLQGLLKTSADCEYPAEFLVSRLLGKKGCLFTEWETLVVSSDVAGSLKSSPFHPFLQKYGASGIWTYLKSEYQWVYSRMNQNLRQIFTPYFVYHEIDTILACLRCLAGKKDIEPVKRTMSNSLLHNDIQEILISGLDFPQVLQELECSSRKKLPVFREIGKYYAEKGFVLLEILIRNRLFASILSHNSPLLLQTFFQHMVDCHNCLSLAKAFRWQINTEPDIVTGGTVPQDRFRKGYLRKDLTPILRFLHVRDADMDASDVQHLETGLLKFMTGILKKWSFQRTVVGDILFYLWEQYRYSRNISMVCSTMPVDDKRVMGNLVA